MSTVLLLALAAINASAQTQTTSDSPTSHPVMTPLATDSLPTAGAPNATALTAAQGAGSNNQTYIFFPATSFTSLGLTGIRP